MLILNGLPRTEKLQLIKLQITCLEKATFENTIALSRNCFRLLAKKSSEDDIILNISERKFKPETL